ncbi:MAG: acylneuraminate cytidylyltransferase family protein [Cyanobacteriota bacterium]|nr:acylneuraminate cytidylyltransferase family protein [Cyanobacteriota bacterium]
MILGHIGARQGSKGVPGKNFASLHGKPLIDWSLDQLLENPRVGAVVVSTDDPAIHAHALRRGSLDIGLRPAELATDQAPKWGVWQHALATAERVLAEQGLGAVTTFLDLDCTAPLRSPADIEGVLDLFETEQPDLVMSVCEARKNPYFNLVELNGEGTLRVSKPLPGGVWARQAAPKVWEHAASTYAVSPDYLRRASSLYEGRVIPFEMPPERCLDIDSPLDFKLVEWLLGQQLEAGTDA